MQYKFVTSISQLQKSNREAVRTFQINSTIEGIINDINITKNAILQLLVSKKPEAALIIPKNIDSLNKWAG
jgi:hypothetical protein